MFPGKSYCPFNHPFALFIAINLKKLSNKQPVIWDCMTLTWLYFDALQWRHNERLGVSNHQPHDSLFNRLFRRRSEKTPKLRVTGLCGGKSPVTGEFPAQRASNAENVSIWWRHHCLWLCSRYGQMTAGSYCYIGPQGIVHGTTVINLIMLTRSLLNTDLNNTVHIAQW